jgi:hypothetical protein
VLLTESPATWGEYFKHIINLHFRLTDVCKLFYCSASPDYTVHAYLTRLAAGYSKCTPKASIGQNTGGHLF